MSSALIDILNTYKSVSLKEMDSVQLMNRTDSKFMLPFKRLPELLQAASDYYHVLEINQHRIFSYHTTYLDTANFFFFNQHMSCKPSRYKVRYRIYESTGVSYLEVKHKTNKNRTVKSRIKNALVDNRPDPNALTFLSGHINKIAEKIEPVLINRFQRITLAGFESNERITIDFDLGFSNDNLSFIQLPYLAIAEVKREGFRNNSPIINILKKKQIRQAGFSKYCIGNALLRTMPKTNILKSKLLLLQKIENENLVSSVA